jgi:hypothetical protein
LVSNVLERNKRRDTGLLFWISVVLRVGFLKRGFMLATLKDTGTMPEVREELLSEVRNGRMSLETSWRREKGIASRGQVVAWLDVIILLTSSEVRGLNWVKTGYRIDSAARLTRGPALTDDVSTLDVSTQANRQNPEGCLQTGLNHGLKKKAQSVLVLFSMNAARSFAQTKPLETRLIALMNAYVTQSLLGTLILKEENGKCLRVGRCFNSVLGVLEIKWS